MTFLPIYSMSEVGGSSRALAAKRLGYEPTARGPEDEEALDYYTMLEDISSQKMIKEGYEVQGSELCQECLARGVERHGIHVTIPTPLFLLVGHLDRRIKLLNGKWIPVEIKSLGRNSWSKFAKNPFEDSPEYIAQELCYLEAEQSPGIYWVLNRDTGKVLRYIVNNTHGELNKSTLLHYEKFTTLILPDFGPIVDKLNAIEISVASNELPECENKHCEWCGYQYLCEKEPTKPSKDVSTNVDLIRAATMYKEAKEHSDLADDLKEQSTKILLDYSLNTKTDKYHVGGISWTYSGMTQKIYLDDKIIRAKASPELIAEAERKSAPYPKYTIRILKEN